MSETFTPLPRRGELPPKQTPPRQPEDPRTGFGPRALANGTGELIPAPAKPKKPIGGEGVIVVDERSMPQEIPDPCSPEMCPGERVIALAPEFDPKLDDSLLLDHLDRGTRQTSVSDLADKVISQIPPPPTPVSVNRYFLTTFTPVPGGDGAVEAILQLGTGPMTIQTTLANGMSIAMPITRRLDGSVRFLYGCEPQPEALPIIVDVASVV